jgi:hypothetical protein
MSSGYINQFGVRVPNPCSEIDTKGRDLDKIGRWIRPHDKWDEETLDRLNALIEVDPCSILNNPCRELYNQNSGFAVTFSMIKILGFFELMDQTVQLQKIDHDLAIIFRPSTILVNDGTFDIMKIEQDREVMPLRMADAIERFRHMQS